MFWLKSCPRCKGDLYQECDIYGPYTACLQCGHYLAEEEEATLRNTAERQSAAHACEETAGALAEVA